MGGGGGREVVGGEGEKKTKAKDLSITSSVPLRNAR